MAEVPLICAGKLRHRVIVQKRETGISTTRGKATGSWTTFASVWADVVVLTGREAEIARGTYGRATVQIKIRHLAGLTRKHRVKFGSHIFNIGHINNVDFQDRLNILLCGEETT